MTQWTEKDVDELMANLIANKTHIGLTDRGMDELCRLARLGIRAEAARDEIIEECAKVCEATPLTASTDLPLQRHTLQTAALVLRGMKSDALSRAQG